MHEHNCTWKLLAKRVTAMCSYAVCLLQMDTVILREIILRCIQSCFLYYLLLLAKNSSVLIINFGLVYIC